MTTTFPVEVDLQTDLFIFDEDYSDQQLEGDEEE
jgi:hypothetical protein